MQQIVFSGLLGFVMVLNGLVLQFTKLGPSLKTKPCEMLANQKTVQRPFVAFLNQIKPIKLSAIENSFLNSICPRSKPQKGALKLKEKIKLQIKCTNIF